MLIMKLEKCKKKKKKKILNNKHKWSDKPHIDSTNVLNKVKHLENTKLASYNIRAH